MKFTIYSKSGCPYCEKIIQVMDHINADYYAKILNYQFTREEFYSKFGNGSTFPQVVLNDSENLGGCVDTIKFLQEKKIL